jgi:hypothetical protein
VATAGMDDVKVSIGLRPESASNAEARAVNFTEEEAGPYTCTFPPPPPALAAAPARGPGPAAPSREDTLEAPPPPPPPDTHDPTSNL